jgi:hypothetical protein
VLEAYQHQDLPIELLVQSLSWERESEPRALFQAAFAFQNLPKSEWQFPGLIVEGYEILNGMAHRDLTLFIKETNSGFSGSFEYDAAVFDAATISELARQYGALLEGVVGDPTQRVDRISLSSPQEQRVLEQFRSVLENPQIGPHDSFFNAGGDSLLALKLLARLENLSGNDIPPATLFEHPTAATFAVVLHNVVRGPLTTTDLGAHIIEIRRGLSKFPLFLIPGGSGGKAEMMLYSRMFSHFVGDQRVYGCERIGRLKSRRDADRSSNGRPAASRRFGGCNLAVPIPWLVSVSVVWLPSKWRSNWRKLERKCGR